MGQRQLFSKTIDAGPFNFSGPFNFCSVRAKRPAVGALLERGVRLQSFDEKNAATFASSVMDAMNWGSLSNSTKSRRNSSSRLLP